VRVLVTGGAGYIGSIVTEELVKQGLSVVVFDNLSAGHRGAVHPGADFVEGDLADRDAVRSLFDAHSYDGVMHFAANTLVGESMAQPFKYLGDNVVTGSNLMEEAVAHGVRRFILSSTANLFGDPERIPIDESERIVPGSPYGESKHILERILHWLDIVHGLHYATLRYFNAAGASPTGERGAWHVPETHLIPRVLEVALGKRDNIVIYGDDYPTSDGTCVRDYIHVCDLAQAHILALQALDEGSRCYNLGNGCGFTVREVIDVCRRVTGHDIPATVGSRRPGDPATLVAGSDRIRRELGWRPQYPELETIVEHSWRWYRTHPNGYND
jgi:UDP-glucose 4-epimerase